jgi:hypothetical protein
MRDTLYHKLLRIGSLVTAITLVYATGLLHPSTADMFDGAIEYLGASVGMSASVAPNEFNSITAELTAQRTALATREAMLEEREIAVSLRESGEPMDRSTYVLASILFIMLVLIVLNYVLDFVRQRPAVREKPSMRPVM